MIVKRFGLLSVLVMVVLIACRMLDIRFSQTEAQEPSATAAPPAEPGTLENTKSETSQRASNQGSEPSRNQTIMIPPPPLSLICEINRLELGIPLSGNVKIASFTYQSDENGLPGSVAWIYSNECPVGLYSKVRLDKKGNLMELIDCRQTTKEELVLRSGVQGDVKDTPPERGHLNIAISGPGFFVERCDETLSYVRNGQFLIAPDRTIQTKSGCEILSEDGSVQTISVSDQLDENGCNEQGECIAIANPSANDVQYGGRDKLSTANFPLASLLRESHLLMNAFEDLTQPEFGPFGPDFSQLHPLEGNWLEDCHDRTSNWIPHPALGPQTF